MTATTVALLGATGGAGTTRTCLELATTIAVDGADVAVVDAAYDTQGLARHLSGRLDPDVTALVTDETDRPLEDGLVAFDPAQGGLGALESPPETVGRVACCPARAPFERLARAKSADAARTLERRIEAAAAEFDYVLVDVPPLGSNPAVAAVAVADRIAVVSPASSHGVDAVQTTRGRLQDVGTAADAVVAVDRDGTGAFDDVDESDNADVDAVVPRLDAGAPACLRSVDGATALADVAAATTGRHADLSLADPSVFDRVDALR